MTKWIWLLLLVATTCDRRAHDAPPPAASSARAAPTSTTAAGIHYQLRHTGGARSDDELIMIVAIHGLGDRPESFGALFSDLPLRARVVLPRAPSAHGEGWSWFPIDVRDPAASASGIEGATTALAGMLAALVKAHPTRGKPIVTGFSQGGMLSLALAVHHPGELAVAVPIAGWLPPPLIPAHAPHTAARIVALHGDADPLLPIEPTRSAIAELRRRGFPAELREYPGVGHNVSGAMRRDLYRELARAATEQAR